MKLSICKQGSLQELLALGGLSRACLGFFTENVSATHLRVTWHFSLDECVGSDTWRQICCHQRGGMLGLERVLSYKREQSFLQVSRHGGA